MTTMHDLNDGVVTNRRRSRKGIPAVRKVFGDDIHKLLIIPLMFNDYNHHVGGVLAGTLKSTLILLESR